MPRYSRRHKKRIEKRRKTRRTTKTQVGGAGIDSIDAWIKAVNETPAFNNRDQDPKFYKDPNNPALQLGSYRMSDLIDTNLAFDPNSSDLLLDPNDSTSDIRIIANALRRQFNEFLTQDPAPTAYEFMKHIERLMTSQNIDSSIRYTINLAEIVEDILKEMAGIKNKQGLTNPEAYPLYLLTLLMNTSDEDPYSPVLATKDEIEKELQNQRVYLPTLDQQEGSAI